MNVEEVVRGFVEAINHADVERLAALMTEDHVFIDSDGSKTSGRETMRKLWSQYFSMVPDYRVAVEERFCSENKVVLIGAARGTYAPDGRLDAGRRWSVPAAWRAVVSGDRLAVWQVFVNPEPMVAAMRQH